MTTDAQKPRTFNSNEWILKSEAARLRGVSRQAIWELVRRKRLGTTVFAGKVYLQKSEVMSFKRRPRGPASMYVNRESFPEKKGKPKKKGPDPAIWISQVEAAEIRGITRQAIADLVRRGYFRTREYAGKALVLRSQVKAFKPPRPKPVSKRAKKK
ncbi:MAG: hypothetical protein LAO78_21915 [Acidobacteriia bacterium]|nr:hypothetical protein [Terriglobia bacterium]